MELDTFEIAQNEKNLQYFAQVRQSMQANQINYWFGNPSAEIFNGIIYLKPTTIQQTQIQPNNLQQYIKSYHEYFLEAHQQPPSQTSPTPTPTPTSTPTSKTLALVSIPNSKSPLQVCQRLSPYLQSIKQIKVIKTNHFKFYAMLLLMADQESSRALIEDMQGEEYNGVEIERVLVREVVGVGVAGRERVGDGEGGFQNRKRSAMNAEDAYQRIASQQIFFKINKNKQASNSPRKKQQLPKPPQSPTQPPKPPQPTPTPCPICLQQTDSTLITILCSHHFHLKCLSQWKQNICPLCRYHQHPPLIKFCQKCNQCEGLWVCLVCGVRLCCGFHHDILGDDSHIYEHYKETGHRLSMEVETKFVFDASQPAFLHHMFYREVMKNPGLEVGEGMQLNKKGKKNKLSQKISQYQQSISQQMQKQRLYFQQSINKQLKLQKQQLKQTKKTLLQLQSQLHQLDTQLLQLQKTKHQHQQTSTNYQQQLKQLQQSKKILTLKVDRKKVEDRQLQELEDRELRRLDQLIEGRKEELKDYRRNLEIGGKIRANVGKDGVAVSVVFGGGGRDNRKKKK